MESLQLPVATPIEALKSYLSFFMNTGALRLAFALVAPYTDRCQPWLWFDTRRVFDTIGA